MTVLLAVVALGSAGCSTYQNSPQGDSAYVRGSDNAALFNGSTHTFVGLTKVDGSAIVNMSLTLNFGVYVQPGTHEILLTFNPLSEDFYDSDASVEVTLLSGHRYRFSISNTTVDITLWDETAGADKATKVAEWTFGGADPVRRDAP